MHKRTTFKTATQLADEYLARQIEQAPDAATKAKFEAVRQQSALPESESDLEVIREKFRFDSSTGIIYWCSGVRNGHEAGHLDGKGYRALWHNGKSLLGHRVAWLLHYGE